MTTVSHPSTLSAALFGVVGLINFIPVVGVISSARLGALYGPPTIRAAMADPSLVVLLRHRAVLLGIVGAILLHAAAVPNARPIAAMAGFISMLSYMGLAATAPRKSQQLTHVLYVDVVACVLLAVAVVM